MFAEAVTKAMKYTRPLMRVRRYYDGRVEFPLGALVVVNREGWFVSAAHSWKDHGVVEQHRMEIAAYEQRRSQIGVQTTGRRTAFKRSPTANPGWVTHDFLKCLFVEKHQTVDAVDVTVDPFTDIAVGRLDSFDPSLVACYPVFPSAGSNLSTGTMLCKLGFPFPMIRDVRATLNGENLDVFFGSLQLPYFPLEGMFTRTMIAVDDKDDTHKAHFLETSAPGVPGQSGGPTFDANGVLWALQSQLLTIDLGIKGKHREGNRDIEVPQFLNLGLGAHVDEIRRALDARSVAYETTKV